MSSCGNSRGCDCLCTFECTLRYVVCSTPPCHVLFPSVGMGLFKQGERMLIGFDGRIVTSGHIGEMHFHLKIFATRPLTSCFKIKHPIP